MAAKKSDGYAGLVTCKSVDGSGAEISRQYHLEGDGKSADELFALFVDHFRPETHGAVSKEKFTIETA